MQDITDDRLFCSTINPHQSGATRNGLFSYKSRVWSVFFYVDHIDVPPITRVGLLIINEWCIVFNVIELNYETS